MMHTKRSVNLVVITAAIGMLGLVAGAQAEVRVSPNYRLNSDPNPFRGKDQVSLAVNPGNPSHVVQVNANYLTQQCEGTASFDGGDTWTTAFPLTLPTPPAPLLGWLESCSTYQSVEFGSGQNVYATSTAARIGASADEGASTLVFKSTDGGLTWAPGVVAMAGGPGDPDLGFEPADGPSFFRPTLSVQPGAGEGGADRVYVAALDFVGADNGAPCSGTPPNERGCGDMRLAVSHNGGASFGASVHVAPVGTNATDGPSKPVINSDDSVSVAWRTVGREALIQVSRSTDRGQSFGAPVDVARVVNTGTSTATHVPPTPPATTGSSASASYPRMVRGTSPGRIYMVYSQGSTGPTAPAGGFRGADHFISPDSAVWFQRSLDNGATWSVPKLISDRTQYPGSQTVQTRHPSVSVSPGGRINVVWHDRRHWYQERLERNCTHSHIFCTEVRLGDTYLSYSTDGGNSFSDNIRISDRSHNNEVGYDTRPSAYWNYSPQAVTVPGGDLLVGWMDSREGNWDTDTEDIYLAKVDFDASGAAPVTHIDHPDVISRSVALSQLGYPSGAEGALNGVSSRNATSVVIVNEGDVPAALAGAVLGRANPGPVLLSPASGLPASVRNDVSRLTPQQVFVIGDSSRLSGQVVSDLEAAGVDPTRITRVSGDSDAETAAAIARQLDRRTDAERTARNPAFDAAVIADPASPDAAAAAGLAAARRLPFLYVNADSVPQATRDALASLDIDRTLVIGGTSVVSSSVADSLPNAKRLGGGDPYDTSREVVAESRARGLPANVVYVADGSQPMDAALLSGVVARATGLMVLAPAPLHATAAGQASAFGLSRVSRLFVVGPTAPGADGGGGSAEGGSGPGDAGAASPGATAPGAGGSPRDTTAPSLTRASLSRRTFRVAAARSSQRAPAGTTIRFTLSESARVSIVAAQRTSGRRSGTRCVRPTSRLRRAARCTLIRTRGTLSSSRARGANSVQFSGRFGRRALRPGQYQLTLRATDAAGNRSRPVVLRFRIVR